MQGGSPLVFRAVKAFDAKRRVANVIVLVFELRIGRVDGESESKAVQKGVDFLGATGERGEESVAAFFETLVANRLLVFDVTNHIGIR